MDAPDAVLTAAVAPPAVRADYLLVIDGERSWTVALPTIGDLVIGRSAEAQVKLADEVVSRTHAQVVAVPGGLRVKDLGSRHGTLVNGQPIAAARQLSSGDVIGIGGALLIVHRARVAPGRAMIDADALMRRLDEELERALHYRRELAFVVLRGDEALDPARATAVIADRLRVIDAAAFLSEREIGIVLPEDDPDEVVAELAGALAVAAGVAMAPADGVAPDTLVACARAASAVPRPGSVALSTDAVRELRLGDHDVLLADPAMVRTYDLIKRLARSALPILIQGETGAGKELAAAAVHAFSPRADRSLVSINCAAIPEQLAESELFGHERGAFTGALSAKPGRLELASGGTVFFDELGELSLAVQAKLLRVLESGELHRVGEIKPRAVDIRVVAATNRDLAAEVAAGRFREDLFFRLAAAQVVVPPLRDRPRDLALLARRMLAGACQRLGRRGLPLSVAATHAVFMHRWPGNVRELKHAMDYAAAAAPDTAVAIDLWHLPPALGEAFRHHTSPQSAPIAEAVTSLATKFRPIEDEVRELERMRMIEALAATGGVRNKAAELIEMPLRTFVTKLKRYAIAPADWRAP